MKKLMLLFLVVVLALALAACGNPAPADDGGEGEGEAAPAGETYTIKIGTTGSEEHQSTIAARLFEEKVEELTNGGVQVDVYPNSELGGERELGESVKLGTLEMAVITPDGPLSSWVPEGQVLAIPYLFANKQEAYTVLDETLQPYFEPLYEAEGFRILAFCELGFRHFTNNKREVTCADDMKGLTIRVQEAPIWFKLVESLGAVATPVAFNELYTALQQGLVDGEENPIPTISSMRFNEVQQYLCMDGHTYTAETLLIGNDFYNSLPAEYQAALDEAAIYARDEQRKVVDSNEQKQLEDLKAAGMIVCENPDIESFQAATENMPNDPAVQELVDPSLVQMVRDAVDALR